MICFYHKGDLDGHCAGAIVRLCFPNALMLGIDYEDPLPWDLPQIQEDSEGVIMVDFSLPMEEMQRLYHFSQRFIWIDHHKTAIEQAQEAGFNPPGLRVVGTAACELTWEFFFLGWLWFSGGLILHKKPMPQAVRLLGRYDVWDEQHPLWKEVILPFQYGMRVGLTDPANPDSQGIWETLLDSDYDEALVADAILDGQTILTYIDQDNAKLMARHAFSTRLDGIEALSVNHGPGSSMKFEAWQGDSFPLLISYARLPRQKWLVNLYTYQEDVDVGEIAKRHGGGGHRRAAGFICDELPFEI